MLPFPFVPLPASGPSSRGCEKSYLGGGVADECVHVKVGQAVFVQGGVERSLFETANHFVCMADV